MVPQEGADAAGFDGLYAHRGGGSVAACKRLVRDLVGRQMPCKYHELQEESTCEGERERDDTSTAERKGNLERFFYGA